MIAHLGGNTFRIRLESPGVSFARDLTIEQLFTLIEDGLEALVAHVGELDTCPFCTVDDEDGKTDEECTLVTMLTTLRKEAKGAHA